MVVVGVLGNEQMRVVRGWWTLNCSLLQCLLVLEDFGVLWEALVKQKADSVCLLDRWDWCKMECKRFFVRLSKRLAVERYGLLNLLRARLHQVDELMDQRLDRFDEIVLMTRNINGLWDEVAQGSPCSSNDI